MQVPRAVRRRWSGPSSPFDGSRPLRVLVDSAGLDEDEKALLRLWQDSPRLEPTGTDIRLRRACRWEYVALDAELARGILFHHDGKQSVFDFVRDEKLTSEAMRLARRLQVPTAYAAQLAAMASLAETPDFDVFVTSYARAVREEISGAIAMEPRGAIALMGLLLRTNGDFERGVYFPPDRRPMLGWLYRNMARQHLPALTDAIDEARQEASQGALQPLLETLLSRLGAVMRFRDRLHAALLRAAGADGTDELSVNFDALLLFLTASFDVVLSLINRRCELGLPYQSVEFGKVSKRLRKHAKKTPKLQPLIDYFQRPGRAFDLVRALRNTIHGDALRLWLMQSDSGNRVFAELPSERVDQVLERLGAKGREREFDFDRWGLRERRKGHPHPQIPGAMVATEEDEVDGLWAELDGFVEKILPAALAELNELLDGMAWKPEKADREDELLRFGKDEREAKWLRFMTGLEDPPYHR